MPKTSQEIDENFVNLRVASPIIFFAGTRIKDLGVQCMILVYLEKHVSFKALTTKLPLLLTKSLSQVL
jgi:hypothetical protein